MNLLPKWLRIAKVGDVVRIQNDCEYVSSLYRGKIGVVEWMGDKECAVRIPLDRWHSVVMVSKYEVDVQ